MADTSSKVKPQKLKQSSVKDYFTSPSNKLKGYKIITNEWMSKKQASFESSVSHRGKKFQKASTQLSIKHLVKQIGEKNLIKPHCVTSQELSHNNECSSKDENMHSQKNSTKGLNLVKTESFEKYGIIFPSVDNIVETIDRAKKEAKVLEDYENVYRRSEILEQNSLEELVHEDILSKNESQPFLDCKYLSREDLKKYFDNFVGILKGIQNETVSSKRHEVYQNHKLRPKLTYNNSTIVFSEQQREYLLQVLEETFDPDVRMTEYIFMVMLPELCFRIFMSVHNMNSEDTADYLDLRPID